MIGWNNTLYDLSDNFASKPFSTKRGGMTAPVPPPDYDPRAFPPVAVTVDIVLFTIRDDELQLVLVKRGEEPFRGAWALPGGFVRPDEDLAQAAARELAEETAISRHPDWLEQVRAYGGPERDPRMRVVTVAFGAICADLDLPLPQGGGDAAQADLFPVSDVEHGRVRLAFDHGRIVRDALERLRARIETPAVAARFCPPEFTIGQLRRVHEAVRGTKLNPGNFLRRVRDNPWLARTNRPTVSGAAGGRPASVWTLGEGPPRPPVRSAAPEGASARPAASGACFVYQDDPTNRARIHAETCPYFVNRKRETRADNGWHGPFASVDEAWAKIRTLNKRDSGACRHCLG